MKECKKYLELINSYFSTEINDYSKKELFDHISTCKFCSHEFETEKKLVNLFKNNQNKMVEDKTDIFNTDAFLAELNQRIETNNYSRFSFKDSIKTIWNFINANLIQNKLVLTVGVIAIVFFNMYFLFFNNNEQPVPITENKFIINSSNVKALYSSNEVFLKDNSDKGIETKYDEIQKDKKLNDQAVKIDL